MERALGVTQPVLTHISHIGTPRPERGHILNPGSHQKQGVKALREPQKAQEAGAAELDRRQESHGNVLRKASWRREQAPTFCGRVRSHPGKKRTEKKSHCL